MAMENSGVATASSFVDESRLRRYNCGLRSETRGNLRERCLFPSQCIGVFVALLVWERAVAMARRSELIFEQISFKFLRDKCNAYVQWWNVYLLWETDKIYCGDRLDRRTNGFSFRIFGNNKNRWYLNWENKELSKDRGIFDKEMESRFGKSLIVREACYTHRCGGWPWDDVVCATSRENPYPTTPSATQRRSSFARATLPYESLPCFSTPAYAVPDSTRNWRNLSQPRYSTYGVDRSAARFRKPLNSRLFFPFPRCSLAGPT